MREADVGLVIAERPSAYDAILLDVDNGPEGLTRKQNDRLYSPTGLSAARAALREGGVFGVWSSGPRPAFARALRTARFEVEEVQVGARGHGRGLRHVIWLATRSTPGGTASTGRARVAPRSRCTPRRS